MSAIRRMLGAFVGLFLLTPAAVVAQQQTTGTPCSPAATTTVTAEVEVPAGGDGMIVINGGRFGDYGLYLLKGKPVFLYNLLNLERFRWEGTAPLAAGKHTLVFDFKYDGPGLGKGGTGVLTIDGKEIAKKAIPHTTPVIMNLGETLDIGSDTRSGVDDNDYKLPFRFNGKIGKVTIKLGPEQLTEQDQKAKQQAIANAND